MARKLATFESTDLFTYLMEYSKVLGMPNPKIVLKLLNPLTFDPAPLR